ncbi:MAG: hypothetical protein DI537_19125 [Stutzerimonas stutzeri]|nr:MAG: hypothetical protein DI537_19125 [Stutzerimonas stutzeri]
MTKLKRPEFRTLEEMVVAAAQMVQPPERLTVSEAATKYRKLDNPGSYTGPWLNEKTPYLIEPMDELTSLDFTGLIFAGPARTGKSDMFFNWLTHTAICDPADMMRVDMTKDVARDWSIGDFNKMLRNCPDVQERLIPGRQNDNVHDKRFKSGMRVLIKWPTITELSGKTLRYVWFADYDRFANADDVDKEGPAFDLGRKRTQTFKRFGMTVAESSPGRLVEDPKWIAKTPHEAPPTKGILGLYNRGDRRRWQWRCLQCRTPFEPDFSLMNYPASDDHWEAAEMATMKCPHCGFDHEPSMKPELQEHIRNARWVKDGMIWMPDGSMQGRPIRTDIASFWLKGPAAAFQDWSGLVFAYLQAKQAFEDTGDEGPLKKTITADQGLPYSPKANISNRLPEELADRIENWGGTKDEPVVPAGVRFLISTVDVQAGGRPSFVVHVHGICENGDICLVDMFKIKKSERLDEDDERHLLDPASYPEDWHLLVDQVIERTYPLGDGSGRRMAVKRVGCDSGGADGVTANAYAFWRWLRDKHPGGHDKRFQLVKGNSNKKAPRAYLSFPDAQRKDDLAIARGDVPVLLLNTDMLKDMAHNMLGRTDPGAGMVRFPHWSEAWLWTQLTAEIRTTKGWENPRKKRNEAFDLLGYCFALLIQPEINIERFDWSRPPRWAAEWDHNILVFEPAAQSAPFAEKRKSGLSLKELAAALT